MIKYIVLFLLLLSDIAFSQVVSIYEELRSSSVAAETTPITITSQIYESSTRALVELKFTQLSLPDGDDEIDVFVQTTYDEGVTWVDTQNFHFSISNNGTTPKLQANIDGAPWGPGLIRVLPLVDPAAGNELVVGVPTNSFWQFQSLTTTLDTDGTGSNRRVSLRFDTGGQNLYLIATSCLDVGVNTITSFSFHPGAECNGIADFAINMSVPNLLLDTNYQIKTVTDGLAAGDDWSSPRLNVLEWHDPRVLTDGTLRDWIRAYERPLGTQVRIKTVLTGATPATYDFTADVTFW